MKGEILYLHHRVLLRMKLFQYLGQIVSGRSVDKEIKSTQKVITSYCGARKKLDERERHAEEQDVCWLLIQYGLPLQLPKTQSRLASKGLYRSQEENSCLTEFLHYCIWIN